MSHESIMKLKKKSEINMGLNFLMKDEVEVEDEDDYFFPEQILILTKY